MTTTAEVVSGSTALVPKPAEAPKATALPQYAQGFEGAASAPFPAESLKILSAPVAEAEVETKPNGIVYLPGVWYRRILTRAFGAGAWALLPRGPARTMGEIVIYHGALYILGRFVSEAVGECETRGGMSYASSLEGARTDCLTRCCKDLGMATELWDPDWRAGWQAKYCSKKWVKNERTGKEGWVFAKLDKPNAAPAPIAGRNSGGAQLAVVPTGNASADPKANTAASPAAAPPSESTGAPPSDESPPPTTQVTTTTPGEVTTKSSASSQATDDSGEAPNPAELALVRDAAKKLCWSKPKATSWLRTNFGQTSADALTKDQASAALVLLLAAQLDDNDAEYSKVYDRLKAEGKVLA